MTGFFLKKQSYFYSNKYMKELFLLRCINHYFISSDTEEDVEIIKNTCRDVTDQYQTGRSAYLRLGQLFMRLFAGLL